MLKIEDTEIKMWETLVNSSAKCTIKNDVFSCLRQEETLFNSEIFKYRDINVVVCREPRYGESYLNIAAYDETFERAWPLLTLPKALDIFIRRLGKDIFLIWTDSKDRPEDIKQCSFCRMHDTEKIENMTIDYNNLIGLQIINGEYILIEYTNVLGGVGGVERKLVTTLALFDNYGKLVKVFYEFYNKDSKKYTHIMNPEKTVITITEENNKKTSRRIIYLNRLISGNGNYEEVEEEEPAKKEKAPPKPKKEKAKRASKKDEKDEPKEQAQPAAQADPAQSGQSAGAAGEQQAGDNPANPSSAPDGQPTGEQTSPDGQPTGEQTSPEGQPQSEQQNTNQSDAQNANSAATGQPAGEQPAAPTASDGQSTPRPQGDSNNAEIKKLEAELENLESENH